MIGTFAGPYVLTDILGSGASAEVYLAQEQGTGMRFAFKVLRSSCANDSLLLERFHNEARCANLLAECAHVVRVHEVLQVDGRPALRMDYVDGTDLQQILNRCAGRGLGIAQALRYLHDVAYALQHAHRLGVAHRDVKPSNCLLEHASQRIFLSDFGIALRAGAKRHTTFAIGTRAYMPPEVLRGGPGASGTPGDVYAAGVMLYEMLTGDLPFDADDDHLLTQRILSAPLPLPSARLGALPGGIDDLVARCLARNPGDRFPDGAALFSALDDLRTALTRVGVDAGYEPPAEPDQAPHGVLLDVTDPLSPIAYEIAAEGLSIGASSSNQVVSLDRYVSGHHARIVPSGPGVWALTDDSTNGTWVRGHQLHHDVGVLQDGDVFSLGARPDAPRFVILSSPRKLGG